MAAVLVQSEMCFDTETTSIDALHADLLVLLLTEHK
jgi:hypothetical protein